MEMGALNLWANLITVFGNVYFFVFVLAMLFLYTAVKADLNKWVMLSFFGLFFLWIGYEVNMLFVFIFMLALVAMLLEIIRRYMK